MTGFAGFDAMAFPGPRTMHWLQANTNLVWCGYYLAPAPSHGDTSWMGQRAALAAAGWGLAPLFVGQQLTGLGSHDVSPAAGADDGRSAAGLMTREGFAPGSVVFLDLEDGPPFASPRTDYVAAWTAAVRGGGFAAGVYCSHTFAAAVHGSDAQVRLWAYKVDTVAVHPFPGLNFPNLDPAGCGYAGAFAWQLAQNARVTLAGAPTPSLVVDLSSAVSRDPGAA